MKRNNDFNLELEGIMTFDVKPLFEKSYLKRKAVVEDGFTRITYYAQAQSRLWYTMEVVYDPDNILREQTLRLMVDGENYMYDGFLSGCDEIDFREFAAAYERLNRNQERIIDHLSQGDLPVDAPESPPAS
ncbi:MAG: hypothetical protein AAGN35_17755 [Bacteroidota bacterium]